MMARSKKLERDGSEHDFFCFEKGALGSVLQLLPWSPGLLVLLSAEL